MDQRIAFTGASGTGKTTLATFAAELLGLPINPVGSRSVAAAMGFASPYDVDAAGKRAEFQRRLLDTKALWEGMHASFVTDRTTADNLAYTALHDVYSIDADALALAARAISRYTLIIHCPVAVFCNTGDDAQRVHISAYQKVYEATLVGLLRGFGVTVVPLMESDIAARKSFVQRLVNDCKGGAA